MDIATYSLCKVFLNELKNKIAIKHDTEENWNSATDFIPKKSELILYDPDTTYNYTRIKIGDGSTKVSSLPFYIDKLHDLEVNLGSHSAFLVKNMAAIYKSNYTGAQVDEAIRKVVENELASSDEVVLKTTDQSISGIKTFSDGIKSNKAPAEDNDVIRLSDLNNAISQAITTALNTQV